MMDTANHLLLNLRFLIIRINCKLFSSQGMDGYKHEVECVGIQQRQGHQSPAKQSVEAGHLDVQQVESRVTHLISGGGELSGA